MLIEVIPRLHRSKDDLLEFFTTAGVAEIDLRDLRQRASTNRDQISMLEITRTVLHHLSDKKGAGLGVQRAVLQRVTSWENFATGWPNNQAEAERLVGKIQKFVRIKDSLTRAIQSNDEERRHQAEAEHKRLEEIQAHKEASAAIRRGWQSKKVGCDRPAITPSSEWDTMDRWAMLSRRCMCVPHTSLSPMR